MCSKVHLLHYPIQLLPVFARLPPQLSLTTFQFIGCYYSALPNTYLQNILFHITLNSKRERICYRFQWYLVTDIAVDVKAARGQYISYSLNSNFCCFIAFNSQIYMCIKCCKLMVYDALMQQRRLKIRKLSTRWQYYFLDNSII